MIIVKTEKMFVFLYIGYYQNKMISLSILTFIVINIKWIIINEYLFHPGYQNN